MTLRTDHPVSTRAYNDLDISSSEFWGKTFNERDKTFAKLRGASEAGLTWHEPLASGSAGGAVASDSALIPLVPDAADEGNHEPDADLLWSESHYLDATAPGAEAGVYARIGRLANQSRSHVMLAVVRPGAGPVLDLLERASTGT